MLEKARVDLYTFAKIIFPEATGEEFRDGRHIRLVCDKLMQLEAGTITRLMVFMPPGGMKSWTAKIFLAWCFGRHPGWRSIIVSAATQLAIDNYGRPIKDIMGLELYKKIFPAVSIREDAQAVSGWQTDQHGTLIPAGANTAITGRRAALSVVDDVLSEVTAISDHEVDKINEWYGPGLRSRLLPVARELIINTRWRTDDLSGFLLENAAKSKNARHKWEVISIPAILDEDSAALLGLPVGSSFWPEFWPLESLLDKKDDPGLSPAQWNALYMQNPTPKTGNIVKIEWCKIYNNSEAAKFGRECNIPPPIDYVILSMDTAFSEKTTADYSACTVWGVFQREHVATGGKVYKVPSLILLEALKGRWTFPELCRITETLYKDHKPDGVIIEKKASGISLIQEMRLRGLPVIEYMPDTDKLSRVYACTTLFENGRIWFPDTDWAFDVISDLVKFPKVTKRDIVDSCSQAILWMRDTWHVSSIDREDDDSDIPQRVKKSYWDALTSRG